MIRPLTRLLMTASALILGLLGLVATFAPDHVLSSFGAPLSPVVLLMVQVLGALYIGFAALNWMARDNLIGGIYSRPVAIGNLMHFLVASFAIVRLVADAPQFRILWLLAVVYIAFAASFGYILSRHPLRAPPEGAVRH